MRLQDLLITTSGHWVRIRHIESFCRDISKEPEYTRVAMVSGEKHLIKCSLEDLKRAIELRKEG